MTTVLRKSTVRPCPSVRRPSSSSCSSDVEHVGVGLLDLVEQDHRVGTAAHGLGELPALVVADVAGRRPDEARHRVLLHVLGHVDPDHVRLVVEQEVGQRPRQLGLAHAGRPQKDERADRAVRILQPGAGPANGVGDGRHRLVLADDAVVESLLHVQQARLLPLQHLVDGDAGPLRDDRGDVLLRHLLAQERPVLLGLFQLRGLGGRRLLQLGDAAEAQLGGAVQIAAPLRDLRLGLGGLDLLLQLAELGDELLLVLPDGLHLADALAQLRDLGGDLPQALRRGRILLLAEGLLLDRQRRQPPLQVIDRLGRESICILRRLAASSTRSIALSGNWRPEMYRFDSRAAATSAASRMRIPWCTS